MGKASNFLANELLDHVFGAAAYTAPANLYFGLSTTTPTAAGGNVTEPSGGSYARVTVVNNATNFPAASGQAKSNGTAITFAEATGSWGTCTHFVLYDALSGGNMIAYGALTASRLIESGSTASFAIGDFDLTFVTAL